MGSIARRLGRFFIPRYMVKDENKIADDFDTRACYGEFARIAWPAVMETVLIGLISFVDSIMVSTVGEDAIAAVGLTTQPRNIFMAVLFSLSVATNAIVSRRKGENDRDGANRCLSQILPIAFVMMVVLAVVAWWISYPFLAFAGAQEDTIEYAVPYFRITMIGMIFTSISLIINSAQRGSGNTRISMVTNLGANFVNVIFNALLINGIWIFPQLGVIGAAIATAIGNFAGAVIAVVSLLRKGNFLELKWRKLFTWDKHLLPSIAKVSGGTIVEQVFMRIGFFSFAKMVAELGTMEFATHQICMSILTLSFTLGDGLGIAASSLVGQNLGRKRPDRSLVFGRIAQCIGLVAAMGLFVLFAFFGGHLVRMFSDDPSIISVGRVILVILAFVSPIQISQVIFTGCLRGAGDTRFMAWVSLISVVVVRSVIGYVLIYVAGMGIYGAWLALGFDQLTRFLSSTIRFAGGKWNKIKL